MPTRGSAEDVEMFSRMSVAYERWWVERVVYDAIHRPVLDMAARLDGAASPAAVPVVGRVAEPVVGPPATHAVGPAAGPATMVDIGCGTGRLLRRAARRWPAARLIGVDPAAGMLNMARRLAPGIAFERGAAQALPLPDASVDLAVSTLSYHHWPDQAGGLREVARVLRPGGHFILADVLMPYGLSLVVRHFGPATQASIVEALRQAGFQVQAQKRTLARFMLVIAGAKEPASN